MNNHDFWESVRKIIADGFTPEGLDKLEKYAELFSTRRLIFKRFSPQEQHGCTAGGSANVIATILAGAEDSADSELEAVSDFKREFKRAAQQASLGFELKNRRNWTYSTPYVYLSDMHDENVIKSNDGIVYVLDCDIRINTPDLRQGGIRTYDNDVEFV